MIKQGMVLILLRENCRYSSGWEMAELQLIVLITKLFTQHLALGQRNQ